MRSEKELLHSGEIYQPADPEIMREQKSYLHFMYEFNHSHPDEGEKRQELCRKMFAEFGEGSYVEPPFYGNWAGHHVHMGQGVYVNFALTVVDDTHIYIGDRTMIGPNVTMATGGHPVLPELREQGYQFNAAIHIGKNCWIGAGAIILPGVTIGDNSVIGAGAVVSKDIPANVVAMGVPCRVVRPIGQQDRETYFRGRPIPPELLK